MFKNRKVTITVDKKNEGPDSDTPKDSRTFEEKIEVILEGLEYVGKRVFVGVCIYVMLDTHRQVSVARASQPKDTTLKIKAL